MIEPHALVPGDVGEEEGDVGGLGGGDTAGIAERKEPRPVSSNSKNAWTSSSRYSSSQADIETMRQRPVNEDFGFAFPIPRLR